MKRVYFTALILFFIGIIRTHAQFTDLHDFDSTFGEYPYGSLTLSGNKLYGMVSNGGAHGWGCIFSLDVNGNDFKDLYDFDGVNGGLPIGSLTLSGSVLYGMTQLGGIHSRGSVFLIDTNGNGYKVVHVFNDTNGSDPFGSLILSGRILYGMATEGGLHNYGCIFSMDTNGSNYKDILDFNGRNYPEGDEPYSELTLSGKRLYGMTLYGGIKDSGCVFSVDTDGVGYKDLLDLNKMTGSLPFGGLVISGKILYGMTEMGGVHDSGCVFSIDTNGNEYRDLLDFNGTNGASPQSSLIISGRVLYGATGEGGSIGSYGTIFSLDTNGVGYKKLFDFNGINGYWPDGALTLSGNILYGMTNDGGIMGKGNIFSLNYTTVGINDIMSTYDKVKLFPTPNNGEFMIQLPETNEKLIVSIYNAIGTEIYKKYLLQSKDGNKFDISTQSAGIYFYRVLDENDNFVSSGKFIIQK